MKRRRLPQLFGYTPLMFLALTTASAQPAGDGSEAERLPDRILAKWVPVSRSIWRFGNLTIEADSVTWATCVKVPYRVLRGTSSAWLIELVSSPPCHLVEETPFWLEAIEGGLVIVISWCTDPKEIERPLLERNCSSGRLQKLND